MMAIYQIYIQGKSINRFYNKMNHKTFRKLFFDTICIVLNLFIKQPDDLEDNQESENNGKDKLEHINKNNNQMM